MKKGLLFGSLLSCLVLAGCASNDGPAKDESSKDSTATSEQTSQESSKDSTSVESSKDSSSVESSSSSSTVEQVAVTKVSLNKGNDTYLLNGETFQLEATVSPKEATNKDLTWESSAADIVSVDATGLLTTHKIGDAVITVKSVSDPTITDTTTVHSQSIPTGFTFEVKGSPVTELKVDLEGKLKPTVVGVGDHASNSGSWAVEDTTIATVTSWGEFTGLKEGSTTATFTSKHDANVKTTVNLTVAKAALVDKPAIDFEESSFATGYGPTEKPIEVMLNGSVVKITKDATQFNTAGDSKAAVMQGGSKQTNPATLEFDFGEKVIKTFKFDAKIWSDADKDLISTQIEKMSVEHFVDGAWVEASVVDLSAFDAATYKNSTATVNSSKVRLIITHKAGAAKGKQCRVCVDNIKAE